MHVFLTGATGFIGSMIVRELIGAGHQVTGLTRSDEGARQLDRFRARAHRGTIEDPASVVSGLSEADAVIHTAFDHDFSRFFENCEKDGRLIEAMGVAVAGTGKPLIITSGTGMGSKVPGGLATEDHVDWTNPNPRIASERAAAAVSELGASVAVVRLPQVHNREKHGLVSYLIAIARAQSVAIYAGEGANRWAAAHVDDVARLYRLALERHEAGARYHASAEEGVGLRDIANAIGAKLGVPTRSITNEEVNAYLGAMGDLVTHDMPASSEWTRTRLDWEPQGPTLIDDIREMNIGKVVTE